MNLIDKNLCEFRPRPGHDRPEPSVWHFAGIMIGLGSILAVLAVIATLAGLSWMVGVSTDAAARQVAEWREWR